MDISANVQDVIRAFGNPSSPAAITQQPFDGDARHYRRLLCSDGKPDPECLYSYADDLMYQEIQRDLFLVLFPKCLFAWQDDLMKSHQSEYSGFVEQFSAALAKHAGFRDILPSKGYVAVSEFMSSAILDKIDQERALSFSGMRASPYAWIETFCTYGTVFPSVGALWGQWWNCSTTGRSCAVLQYVSDLMYPEESNPIFSPWRTDIGGGAPCLWETDGHIFDQSWIHDNVRFLRETLTPGYVKERVKSAAVTLQGKTDSPVPGHMVSDFDNRAPFVELRIEELLDYLSQPLGVVRQWVTT